MNFMKGSLFHRSTEPEEVEIIEESGGGVLAVWGKPRLRQNRDCGKDRKASGLPEEKCGAVALRYDRPHDALHLPAL